MPLFDEVVPALREALVQREYTYLTPVQNSVLEPELKDRDLLVSAQTGSGKTVAFGLAMASTLLGEKEKFGSSPSPVALVIAPTRELALQVKAELMWLYKGTGAAISSCVGGMDMRTERMALSRSIHIVVGTPGRLKDHLERGSLKLQNIKTVVLDEADEMLDMGFREDLEFILQTMPKSRRTLMFSATVPKPIVTLAKNYQNKAVRVSTKEEDKQHVDIDYKAYNVSAKNREDAIANVLRYYDAKNALIFCGTRRAVNEMTSKFGNKGFSVVALSGELSQKERTYALQSLRSGSAKVCVATDVAARGLDLPNLELVIHADIPKNSQNLLHRSGRTGRAGRKGTTVLMVPGNARRRTEILFKHANVNATWGAPPSVSEILKRDDQKIVEAPEFLEPLAENEIDLVKQLVECHGEQKIAAAFVRLFRGGRLASMALKDVPSADSSNDREKRSGSNHAFTQGVWFALSAGRKDHIEARWLLPMLCKVGRLQHGDVGKIVINEEDTHVEFSKKAAELFLKAISPELLLEQDISVKKLPDSFKPRDNRERRSRSNSSSDRKGYSGKRNRGEASSDTKKKRTSGDHKDRKRTKSASGEGEKIVKLSSYQPAPNKKSEHKQSEPRGKATKPLRGRAESKTTSTFEKRKRSVKKK